MESTPYSFTLGWPCDWLLSIDKDEVTVCQLKAWASNAMQVSTLLDSDLTFEHVGVTCWRMRDHMEQSQVIPAEAILKQPVLGHTINRPKSHEHT